LAKVKCPIPDCDVEAKWSHQFFTHFIGAHVKGQNDLNSIIENISLESEEEHKSNQKQSANDLEIFDSHKKHELIERINNFEPQEEKEIKSFSKVNGKRESLKEYDLKEFIGGNCREERQYALYLAYALEKLSNVLKKIVSQENDIDDFFKNQEIVEVFYEATLMRDHWNIDKKSFNEKLWEFVKDKPGNNRKMWPVSKGIMQNVEKHANYWSDNYAHPLARWMMNAKPDIAVISSDNNQDYYLSFIECKYLSGIDTYRYSENGKIYELSQLKVQKYILEFLCGLKDNSSNDSKLKYDKKELKKRDIILVQFNDKPDQKANIIKETDIDDLKEFCLYIKSLLNLPGLRNQKTQ